IFGAVHEARFPPPHEVESEHVEARHGNDSSVMSDQAFAVEGGHMQPAVVRQEAARPDDCADIAARQIEAQPRAVSNACSLVSFGIADWDAWTVPFHPGIDPVEKSCELQVRHGAMIAQRSRKLSLAAIKADQAANDLNPTPRERVEVEHRALGR